MTWAIRDQLADRTGLSLHRVEACAGAAIRIRQNARAGHTYDFPTAYPQDSLARLASIGDIGTRIDGGGPTRGIAPAVHPDAELLASLIDELSEPWQRQLVRTHARRGVRPDWLALRQPLVAEQVPSNRPGRYRHVVSEVWEASPSRSELAAWHFARGRSLFLPDGRRRIPTEEEGFRFRQSDEGGRELLVRWCPLTPKHSDAEILEANTDYVGWHHGMTELLKRLRGRSLRDHTVTGFAAPALPWEFNP